MTDDEPARSVAFVHVRLWLALLVIACVFELVTGLAQNQRLGWPPGLVGPAIFATVWTGLSLAQRRYNAPRSR